MKNLQVVGWMAVQIKEKPYTEHPGSVGYRSPDQFPATCQRAVGFFHCQSSGLPTAPGPTGGVRHTRRNSVPDAPNTLLVERSDGTRDCSQNPVRDSQLRADSNRYRTSAASGTPRRIYPGRQGVPGGLIPSHFLISGTHRAGHGAFDGAGAVPARDTEGGRLQKYYQNNHICHQYRIMCGGARGAYRTVPIVQSSHQHAGSSRRTG